MLLTHYPIKPNYENAIKIGLWSLRELHPPFKERENIASLDLNYNNYYSEYDNMLLLIKIIVLVFMNVIGNTEMRSFLTNMKKI